MVHYTKCFPLRSPPGPLPCSHNKSHINVCAYAIVHLIGFSRLISQESGILGPETSLPLQDWLTIGVFTPKNVFRSRNCINCSVVLFVAAGEVSARQRSSLKRQKFFLHPNVKNPIADFTWKLKNQTFCVSRTWATTKKFVVQPWFSWCCFLLMDYVFLH